MKRLTNHLLVLCLILCAAYALSIYEAEARQDAPEVFVARVEGEINGRAADYVGRVISEASDAGAEAVAIEISTPGGSLQATQEIVEAESNAEGMPIITYVSPRGARAASAGTFIVMGSDVAAMAPQTRLGAATPVDVFGRDIPGALGEKVSNDAVALIIGLAEAHGRNEEWAESAVREAEALDAERALDTGVVEYVEPDLRAVLESADGETVEPKGLTLDTAGATLVQKPRIFRERFGIPLYVLVTPLVLVLLATAAILFAFSRTRRWRVSTGKEGMIGEVGTVRRTVSGAPGGMVFVHGELWRALPEDPASPPLEPGTEVEVAGFRRTAIVVRPAGPESS